MLSYNELKDVRIDQAQGKFVSEGLEATAILPIVVLAEYKGRALSGGFACRSVHGHLPSNPLGQEEFGSSPFGPTCRQCQMNSKSIPASDRCRALFSLVVMLANGDVRRLGMGIPSQSALEQHLVTLDGEIDRIEAEEGIALTTVDFVLNLVLEKRPGMRMWSLQYPIYGKFHRIGLVDGSSKYGDLYDYYSQECWNGEDVEVKQKEALLESSKPVTDPNYVEDTSPVQI